MVVMTSWEDDGDDDDDGDDEDDYDDDADGDDNDDVGAGRCRAAFYTSDSIILSV